MPLKFQTEDRNAITTTKKIMLVVIVISYYNDFILVDKKNNVSDKSMLVTIQISITCPIISTFRTFLGSSSANKQSGRKNKYWWTHAGFVFICNEIV